MSLGGIYHMLGSHRVIWFLVLFEMFQRFNFYGYQAVMFLFLKHELAMPLHTALGSYHVYLGLSCFVPVVGTIVADLHLNNYLSILVVSLYALLGNLLIVLAAAAFGEDGLNSLLSIMAVLMVFGLALRAVGGGGVREIVRALGNAQFELPAEQAAQLNFHQMLHYFMTCGTILGFLVTPLLRMSAACLGQLYCFPLAFGVPALGILLAYLALLCGHTHFHTTVPGRSVIVEFIRCVEAALQNLRGGGKNWIDNASYAYQDKFVDDTLGVLRVLWLFIPLPIFWALFEQAGSRWVYQGSRMIGRLGDNWFMEPDQVQVVIPLVILVVMPGLEHACYPLLASARWVLSTPKQRMFWGAVLAVLAFAAAALVEIKILKDVVSDYSVPPGEGDVMVWNLTPCPLKVTTNIPDHESLAVAPLHVTHVRHVTIAAAMLAVTWQVVSYREGDAPEFCAEGFRRNDTTWLIEEKIVSIVNFVSVDNATKMFADRHTDDVKFRDFHRCDLQLPRVCMVYSSRMLSGASEEDVTNNGYPPGFTAELMPGVGRKDDVQVRVRQFMDPNHNSLEFFHTYPSRYTLRGGVNGSANGTEGNTLFTPLLKRGEVGAFIVTWNNGYAYNYTQFREPLKTSMWLLLPQYVLISVAEFLFPMTLLEYSHAQVPAYMKPVLTSFWLLTVALGNLLVAILSYANLFDTELWYYVMFASLMMADCFLLLVLLVRHKEAPAPDELKEEEVDVITPVAS